MSIDLLSHKDDPKTSRKAAEIAEGRARCQAVVVYRLLPIPPLSLTASECSKELEAHELFSSDWHVRLYQVRRRLSDLRRLGLADRKGRRDGQSCWSLRAQGA